jgi:hypothetical protein
MITRYERPVTECGWHHDRSDTEMTAADWRGTIEASVSAVLEREYMDADRIVGAHLATHTPLQWLETVARERRRGDLLEAKLASAMGAMEAVAGFDKIMAHLHASDDELKTAKESAKTGMETMAGIIQKASAGND